MVFTTRYGTPIEPRNFNRSFHARCTKAGVRRIRVHDARHTCATLLADLEVHPRIAMAILRHAQIAINVEIYTEASSPATRAALKRLERQSPVGRLLYFAAVRVDCRTGPGAGAPGLLGVSDGT